MIINIEEYIKYSISFILYMIRWSMDNPTWWMVFSLVLVWLSPKVLDYVNYCRKLRFFKPDAYNRLKVNVFSYLFGYHKPEHVCREIFVELKSKELAKQHLVDYLTYQHIPEGFDHPDSHTNFLSDDEIEITWQQGNTKKSKKFNLSKEVDEWFNHK